MNYEEGIKALYEIEQALFNWRYARTILAFRDVLSEDEEEYMELRTSPAAFLGEVLITLSECGLVEKPREEEE